MSAAPASAAPESAGPRRAEPLRVLVLAQAVARGGRSAPYGAARVLSALKAGLGSAVDTLLINAYPGDTPEELAAKAAAFKPGLLGLSLYLWNRTELLRAAALAKAALPGLLVVAGGPEASADPRSMLAEGAVDVVIRGEGEEAMLELCRELIARPGSAPQPGIRSAAVPDLAALPSPWLDGSLDPSAFGGAAVELTRGCPYRCAFCYESKGDARLRRFPLVGLKEELKRFQAAGVGEVFVLDPTFNANAEHLKEAVKAMREAGPELRYYLELRGELVDREQARLLSSLDCSLQIGLQSSNPAALANVNRTLDPKRFAKALRLLEEEGLLYGLDLIYGLPGDSLEGFKSSLDYALALGPNHLDIFRLAVLPGTALHDRAAELGLAHEAEPPYLVRSAPGFPASDLDKAQALAEACEGFYNRGRAVMWFRPLAEALGQRPSRILEAWADYTRGRLKAAALGELGGLPHAALEERMLAFTRSHIEKDGNKKSAALALAAGELIRVSGAWTRALAEGDTTTLALSWEPEELLDYAPAGLRDFAAEEKTPGDWLCEPGPEGPRFRKAQGKGGNSRRR
jgi:radical SAM superfamily enzyme YgiQ (UPF0313 family)